MTKINNPTSDFTVSARNSLSKEDLKREAREDQEEQTKLK